MNHLFTFNALLVDAVGLNTREAVRLVVYPSGAGRGNIGIDITPEEARKLAASLLRNADYTEAVRRATLTDAEGETVENLEAAAKIADRVKGRQAASYIPQGERRFLTSKEGGVVEVYAAPEDDEIPYPGLLQVRVVKDGANGSFAYWQLDDDAKTAFYSYGR